MRHKGKKRSKIKKSFNGHGTFENNTDPYTWIRIPNGPIEPVTKVLGVSVHGIGYKYYVGDTTGYTYRLRDNTQWEYKEFLRYE